MTRNIVVCIILSIITSGLTVILLSIITCGIYGLYWNYKMGKAYMTVNGGNDNSLLFILLSLFGFSIVNWAIMQNDINHAAGMQG